MAEVPRLATLPLLLIIQGFPPLLLKNLFVYRKRLSPNRRWL